MYPSPNRIQQSPCQQARALQLAARWNALIFFMFFVPSCSPACVVAAIIASDARSNII